MSKGAYLNAALCTFTTVSGLLVTSSTHSDWWLLFTVIWAVLAGMGYQEILSAGKAKQ